MATIVSAGGSLGSQSSPDGSDGAVLPPGLADILRCFICLSGLKKAVMCPSCSKMGCEACLRKWLTEQRSQCPHCRCPLTTSRLVPCRFVEELHVQLQTVVASSSPGPTAMEKSRAEDDVCSKHPKAPLYYFCTDCKTAICSDCALFDEEHRSHNFSHLSKVHTNAINQLGDLSGRLTSRLTSLQEAHQTLLHRLETLDRSRKESEADVRRYVLDMERELDVIVRDRADVVASDKRSVEEEIEGIRRSLEELRRRPESMSMREVVLEVDNIVREVEERHQTLVSSFTDTSSAIPLTLPNPFMPPYTSVTFTLTSFSHHRHTANVLFSPPAVIDGVAWRLKVYAGGNGVGRGGYVSVFVEMMGYVDIRIPAEEGGAVDEGAPESGSQSPVDQREVMDLPEELTGRYQYKIELLPSSSSQADSASSAPTSSSSPNAGSSAAGPAQTPPLASPQSSGHAHPVRPVLTREYTSSFTQGECWGYNKFCKVATLLSEGYWDETSDCLTFRWGVRAATWRGKSIDMERYVRQLESRLTSIEGHPVQPGRTESGMPLTEGMVVQQRPDEEAARADESSTSTGVVVASPPTSVAGPTDSPIELSGRSADGDASGSAGGSSAGGSASGASSSARPPVPKPPTASSSSEQSVGGPGIAGSSSGQAGLAEGRSRVASTESSPISPDAPPPRRIIPSTNANANPNPSAVFGPNPWRQESPEPTDVDEYIPESPNGRPADSPARVLQQSTSSGGETRETRIDLMASGRREGSVTPTEGIRRSESGPAREGPASADGAEDRGHGLLREILGRTAPVLNLDPNVLSGGQMGDGWQDWMEDAVLRDLAAMDSYGRSSTTEGGGAGGNFTSGLRSGSTSPLSPQGATNGGMSTAATPGETASRFRTLRRRQRSSAEGSPYPGETMRVPPSTSDSSLSGLSAQSEDDRSPVSQWLADRRRGRDRHDPGRAGAVESMDGLVDVDALRRLYERGQTTEDFTETYDADPYEFRYRPTMPLGGSSASNPFTRRPAPLGEMGRLADAEVDSDGWELFAGDRFFPRTRAGRRGATGNSGDRRTHNIWADDEDDGESWPGMESPLGRAAGGNSAASRRPLGAATRADSWRLMSRWQQLTQNPRFTARDTRGVSARDGPGVSSQRHAALPRLEGLGARDAAVAREGSRLESVLRGVGGGPDAGHNGHQDSDGEVTTPRATSPAMEPGEIA